MNLDFILTNRTKADSRIVNVIDLIFNSEFSNVIVLPLDSTIFDILVTGVLFDSKSQAKKNFKPKQRKHSHGLNIIDSFGHLSFGLHECIVGKLNVHICIWQDKKESDSILDN